MSESPTGGPVDRSAATAGARLRSERESRGLSIDQVAAELRLDSAAIEALETGQYSTLGPPVFVKGHLQNYAALLGLEAAPLLAVYGHEGDPEPTPFSLAMKMGKRRRWKLALAIVVLLLVVICAIAVWVWTRI